MVIFKLVVTGKIFFRKSTIIILDLDKDEPLIGWTK